MKTPTRRDLENLKIQYQKFKQCPQGNQREWSTYLRMFFSVYGDYVLDCLDSPLLEVTRETTIRPLSETIF